MKGLQYLEQLKKIPKKRSGSPISPDRANKTERNYPNYLTHSSNMSQHKPWKKILKSNVDKQ